jgi:hypothetical protein
MRVYSRISLTWAHHVGVCLHNPCLRSTMHVAFERQQPAEP